MDMTEHIRTYQNPGITYDQIVEGLAHSYPDGITVMTAGDGEPIPGLIVQYKETDWAFLSRLATHFDTVVTPNFTGASPAFWFGMPNSRNTHTLNSNYYNDQRR